MINEDVRELFFETFDLDMTWLEASEKLLTLKNDENYIDFTLMFCDLLLQAITRGIYSYPKNYNAMEMDNVKCFVKHALILEKETSYYPAVAYFFMGEYKKCWNLISDLPNFLGFDPKELEEGTFEDCFLIPFKNAYKGFWADIVELFSKYGVPEEIIELPAMFNIIYNEENIDTVIDYIERDYQANNDSLLDEELLATFYFEKKDWRKALQYFERVKEDVFSPSALLLPEQVYSSLGFAYSKVGQHRSAVKSYLKVLELIPDDVNTLNNIAYEYYRLKSYSNAIKYALQALDINPKMSGAVNTYLKALLAAGKYLTAKAFVKDKDLKISKDILIKIEKSENNDFEFIDEDISVDKDNVVEYAKLDFGEKKEQFSSEKLLEDELEARLLAGMGAFGKKLKMYQRTGEYGRQYIIPIGRLDLLTEDDKGDLYIVELKKDSGYDDAYDQTAAYIDWFEKNFAKEGQKVYGIICLNSPTEDQIIKVKNDSRVEMYEYKISYNKVV